MDKVKELEKKKWEYYNLYKKYDELMKKELEDIQKNCEHQWDIDNSCYDFRTIYVCKKCGK